MDVGNGLRLLGILVFLGISLGAGGAGLVLATVALVVGGSGLVVLTGRYAVVAAGLACSCGTGFGKGLRGCLSKLPQHKPSTHSDPQARLLDKCSSSKAYARWQALATSYPFLA